MATNWLEIYDRNKAVFTHDGNPLRPHLLFTNGLHAKSYVQGKIITGNRTLCNKASYELVQLIQFHGVDINSIDQVVGPDENLTKRIAWNIGTIRREPCAWFSPKKEGDGKDKKFIFPDLKIFAGERILLCDDTLSTGSSLDMIGKTLGDARALILPFDIVIWNRSGAQKLNGRTVLALIEQALQAWTAEECKEKFLCSLGSEAIRPRINGELNPRLTATY